MNPHLRGGYVDYSRYDFCTSCTLRIPKEWDLLRCVCCNRRIRKHKKNKRADKKRELLLLVQQTTTNARRL